MCSSTSDSLPPEISSEDSTLQRPKILEALGSRATILKRFVVKTARKLPIVGTPIGYVDDTLSPWLEPVIGRVEKDGLYLLSLVDNQIHTVSDAAMAHVPLAAMVIPQLQILLSGQPLDAILVALDRVRTRGVIGYTADIWVEYEAVVKNNSQHIYNLAIRVPGLNVFVIILRDITSSFVSFASDWLVTHSEMKDKHEILLLRKVSPAYIDPPITEDKGSKPDDNEVLYSKARGDSDSQHFSDRSYTEALVSTEIREINSVEIDDVPVQDKEWTATDTKGKFTTLTVVHEDEEEHDELTSLFDTWGMGVNAISPSGLKSIRTHSLKEGCGSKKPRVKTFASLPRSFGFYRR